MRRFVILLLILMSGEVCFSQNDTVKVVLFVTDTCNKTDNKAMWVYGYSVREKHNTKEDTADPGGMTCIDNYGKPVPCFRDYWVHLFYLNDRKKPVSNCTIIWQDLKVK